MLLDILIIVTTTILIWSLPPQSRAEVLERPDLGNPFDGPHDQAARKELVWLPVGHPDGRQWEAQGHGGVRYKVWFEEGVWRVQKTDNGIALLEVTAISEREAKGVAVLEHG